MGTKIHCESYWTGFHSMRNLNEDSSSGSWPLFFGDRTATNGHCYNGFMQRASVDGHQGNGKNVLKQRMLEHEAVFRNQVSELHRLYRIQRDMMDEVKRKEPSHKHRASVEPAPSSSIQGSKLLSNDAGKWHMAGFPLLNSGYDRTPVSDVKFANSPLSCTKRSAIQLGQLPLQNGSISKDSDTLDSRPLKVRKKLFDLHLPAEEYMDTEEAEKLQEHKVADLSSYTPNGNPKDEFETSKKFVLGDGAGVKTDRWMDASGSASRFMGSVELADLNNPIQTEQATAPSSLDFFGCVSENEETKRINEPAKSNAGYLGTTQETARMSDGFLIPSAITSKVNDRRWLSNAEEAGFSRSNLSSVTQGHQPVNSDLPSHPEQGILGQTHCPPGTRPTGYINEDTWKEATRHGLDSDRNCGNTSNNCLEPVASQSRGKFPSFSSSSFASSWDNSHPGPVWAKPLSTFAQNATTFEASLNSAAVMSGSSQPSAKSRGPFGGKWHVDVSARFNPVLGSESKPNGFYQAPASGSKGLPADLPLANLYNLNCSRVGDRTCGHHLTNHHLGNILNGSCHADLKPATVGTLNEALSKSSSNDVAILQDLVPTGKGKPEAHTPALPWLKPNPANVNHFMPTKGMLASSPDVGRRHEISDTPTVKKILGFPIFDKGALVTESLGVDCHPEGKSNNERKNTMIDINIACEPDDEITTTELAIEKENKKSAFVRDYIDLNACGSNYEDPPTPHCDRKCAGVKVALDIDLEAPAFPGSEDEDTVSKDSSPGGVSLASLKYKDGQVHDVVLRNAAETMVAIFSSCPQIHVDDSIRHTSEASLEESVHWLVDAVSAYADELEKTSSKESRFMDCSLQQDFSDEMDDFEVMTLQLQEAKEEDYTPPPFFPEVFKEDNRGANTAPNRSRRGLSRRGRQRRDFQRDILPGLATLARHEVTEDIQTFGGLMRASGHPWNSLMRRNGSTRGRRRAVVETVPAATPNPVCAPLMQQVTSIEAGLEDKSLTGWGKTTARRPRRQRCSGSNPQPAAVLT